MPKFITLAGRKQVGKDTSANMIARIVGSCREDKSFLEEWAIPSSKVHVVHFADALKDACVAIFGIDRQDMETEEGKKKLTDVAWPISTMVEMPGCEIRYVWSPETDSRFMNVREVLQFVGTDLFRNQIDPDVWVKSIFRRKYGEDDLVIIADARFPNECAFAKKNGLLVKVERDNGQGGDMHISERALDNYTDYDFVIDNNYDLVALKQKWVEILRGQKIIA
jgi:hypothetical protein